MPGSLRARPRPARTRSSVGILWCHSLRSSMKETPLPLVVLAMTQLGLPGSKGRAANVSSRAAWSWPSVSRTAQPKARNLSGSGSRPMVSSVRSPCCRRLRSTMQTSLSSPKWPAAMAASHIEPSCSSPSPVSTKVRRSAPSIWPEMAMPTATGKPWPSGPVLVSTPGTLLRSGWPLSARERLEERVQLGLVEVAGHGQRRVQRCGRMALAEHEAIAIGIVGVLWGRSGARRRRRA